MAAKKILGDARICTFRLDIDHLRILNDYASRHGHSDRSKALRAIIKSADREIPAVYAGSARTMMQAQGTVSVARGVFR